MSSNHSKAKADKATRESDPFPISLQPPFNADGVGRAIANRYVAWLDLMGAKHIMGKSLSNAANYVGKIHTCAIEAAVAPKVEVFPVIDGCYMLAEKREDLEDALREVMPRLAATFIHEEKMSRKFLVRGGIAAGRIVVGTHVAACNETLSKHPTYKGCLALGTAIGQAYSAEAKAPPFGFWVDITARAFREEKAHPFAVTYWRWWAASGDEGKRRRKALGAALHDYFNWAKKNFRALEYDPQRLDEHCNAAMEYFEMGGDEEEA